jgi:anti-sigma factor RsiW
MSDDDTELVALIDNELDESRRTALMARLAADESLRQRYDALREAGAPLAASFNELLRQAPLARLRAALPAGEPVRPPGRFAGIAVRELAAGIVIGLLAAGLVAWAFGLFREKEGWRTAVAEYADLYSNDTFAPLKPDHALEAAELSFVGAKVGADLTPENVTLPDLRFTTAFMLSHEGHPLAVIAYVDPTGAPVLFCIHANHAPDAPLRSERRGDLSLASWSRGGRGHLVIGHMPEQRAVALAQMLQKRV